MYPLISITVPLFVIYFHSLFFIVHLHEIPYGLAVRIHGFHPGGPGWTPGRNTLFKCTNFAGVFIFYPQLRACLHGGGGPQVGEVIRLGGVTRLSI